MADPNAVALPGGFVYVTKGILELKLEDDELAHILSHECSHVIREHHQRMQKSANLINLANAAVLAGAIIASRETTAAHSTTTLGMDRATTPGGRVDQVATAAVLSNVASGLLLLRYVREYELEADRTGRVLASGAGFDPKGSEKMLQKLLATSYERPGMGIVRTHPYLEDRIQTANTESADLVQSPTPRDPTVYQTSVQEALFYRATEFFHVFQESEAQFLLRNAYNALPTGPLADDSRFQSLAWMVQKQDEKPYRQRDYGHFCIVCEEILEEFPNSNLLSQVLDKLEGYKKRREEIYESHVQKLGSGTMVPAFGEYFIRNYPKDPRIQEVRFALAQAYRKARSFDRSGEVLLDLLNDPKAKEWERQIHEEYVQILPRLTKIQLAHRYFLLLKDEAAQQGVAKEIRALIVKSKSIEDLGRFKEENPASAFKDELNARLTELAKEALAKARIHRGAKEYSEAAIEYYKVARFSPDRELAALAIEELKEMQKLE
jgi:tetratricopeptide (TPR) repeat protein